MKTPIWSKGRESREALLALLPPQAMERYGAQMEAMFAQVEREEHGAMPVEDVARAILHAVTARQAAHAVSAGQGRARRQHRRAAADRRCATARIRASMRLP